jgi:hypothetical protein
MNQTPVQRDILNALEYPMTATAIAHAIGKSKGSQIIEDIQELVHEGLIEVDDSGRNTMYKKVQRRVAVRPTTATTVSDTNASNSVPRTHKLPDGYKAGKLRSDSDGKVYRNILTPDGQKIKLFKGYTLLNINNGDKIVQVANPTIDGWTCINKYVEEKQFTNYKVELGGIGQIGKLEDLQSQSGILDVKITRHNKAA